jgi:hypothetical protein
MPASDEASAFAGGSRYAVVMSPMRSHGIGLPSAPRGVYGVASAGLAPPRIRLKYVT